MQHNFLHCVHEHIGHGFSNAVSSDRLAEPEHRILLKLFVSG